VARDFITVPAPVQKVENMLNVQLKRYRHDETGKFANPFSINITGITFIRTLDPYSVPEYVADEIDLIGGVMRFPQIKSKKSLPRTDGQPFQMVDPTYISQSFDIPTGTIGKSSQNSQVKKLRPT
jgi:hypothetical protein